MRDAEVRLHVRKPGVEFDIITDILVLYLFQPFCHHFHISRVNRAGVGPYALLPLTAAVFQYVFDGEGFAKFCEED